MNCLGTKFIAYPEIQVCAINLIGNLAYCPGIDSLLVNKNIMIMISELLQAVRDQSVIIRIFFLLANLGQELPAVILAIKQLNIIPSIILRMEEIELEMNSEQLEDMMYFINVIVGAEPRLEFKITAQLIPILEVILQTWMNDNSAFQVEIMIDALKDIFTIVSQNPKEGTKFIYQSKTGLILNVMTHCLQNFKNFPPIVAKEIINFFALLFEESDS